MKRETKNATVKEKMWKPGETYRFVEAQVSGFEIGEEVTVIVQERHNYTEARADIIRNCDLIGIYKDINDGAVPTEEQLEKIVEYVGEHFSSVHHALEHLMRDMRMEEIEKLEAAL